MEQTLRYVSPSVPGILAFSCENDFSFGEHIHTGHVLWVNSEGAECFTLGKNVEVLPKGKVSVIEPGVVHANHPYATGSRHLRSLYLEQEFFQHLEKLYTGDTSGRLELPTVVLDNPECWYQTILLHQAVLEGADQMVVEQFALSLFTSILQRYPERITAQAGSGTREGRISRIIGYMQANLADQFSLNDLAALLDCSSYHIIRLFKAATQMSPHAYLVQLRLEAARLRLDQGVAISDAALLSGFSDQSHLTRKFKLRYGVTPGEYLSQKTR